MQQATPLLIPIILEHIFPIIHSKSFQDKRLENKIEWNRMQQKIERNERCIIR